MPFLILLKGPRVDHRTLGAKHTPRAAYVKLRLCVLEMLFELIGFHDCHVSESGFTDGVGSLIFDLVG